jgi:hypothetical protein
MKPIGGMPNGEHTHRSNRAKNPNSAKLDFFMGELNCENSGHKNV